MKAREVRLHADFEADFVDQAAWLAKEGLEARAATLLAEIEDALQLLAELPAAGVLVEERGSESLRRLLLRRTPFVIWYLFDSARSAPVWVLRLFHTRQRGLQPGAARARGRR